VPEIAQAAKPGRKVILLALDGVDWDLLGRYTAAGRMPNLKRLEREGRSGVLTAQTPPLCPLLWTTMMTGVGPLEHGILDYARIDPESGKEEPITSAERRVPAVWDMATAAGRSAAVFGLWATFPAEPVRGLETTDLWLAFNPGEVLAKGVVYPPEAEPWARKALAQAYQGAGFAALAPWLPGLTETELQKQVSLPDPYAHPVSALRQIVLELRAMGEPVTTRLTADAPDLAIVYLQGPDTAAHVFAPYAPPRQESVPSADFRRYSGVPERYFAEIDRLLGLYLQVAEKTGAVLMIASDHGFAWQEAAGAGPSQGGAQGGQGHRPQGMYLLWGSDVGKRRAAESSTVDQVAPTLLALLGLPSARGMAARPLPGVKATPGPAADYRAHFRPGARSGSPGEDPDRTRTASSWNNEGVWLREKGEVKRARTAFEKAVAKDPQDGAALWNLSNLLYLSAQTGEDRDKADEMLLQSIRGTGLSDGAQRVVGRAMTYKRDGDLGRALKLLDGSLAVLPKEPLLWLFRGRYRIDAKQCPEALQDLEQARALDDQSNLTWGALGLAHLCLGDQEAAAQAFRKSLEIDPDQPEIERYLEQLEGTAP
jgi:tetratricopeptide (TPR) repeat protein